MSERIAVLFEYPTLNGGERSMLRCFERLAGGPYEIVAVAPPEGRLAQALQQLDVDHYPVAWRAGDDAKLPPAELRQILLAVARQLSPALLHANSLSLGRLTGSAADALNIPTAAHLRDIIRLRAAAVRDLNRNRRLIAVSQATRQYHVQQGVDSARTAVVYNGVDVEAFRPRSGNRRLHRALGVSAASLIVTMIGQIGLRKGHDVLAAAAPAVVRQLRQAQFVIVGERNSQKPESVEFERKLRHDFERAGIGGHLHRLGYRDDVAEILADSDLLVHPAKQEPLGRVLLEAAAAGTPIVATRVGGTCEILEDGVSARLVPASDPEALARGIVELAGDARKREHFAAAARQRVVDAFRDDTAADNLRRQWQEVLAGGVDPS